MYLATYERQTPPLRIIRKHILLSAVHPFPSSFCVGLDLQKCQEEGEEKGVFMKSLRR